MRSVVSGEKTKNIPYIERIAAKEAELKESGRNVAGLTAEQLVRGQIRNQLDNHENATGINIAKRNAAIMRADMAAYGQDHSKYTKSLGAATGFVAQQYMIAAKRAGGGSLDGVYVYGSGWQWAAMSSSMSPLPDTSTHPKDTVPKQIAEIYQFLKQADANELNDIFKKIDAARANGADEKVLAGLYTQVDNFKSHVRPIIADIDAGFGNASDTYELAKKMIEAGACCIQIENQLSDQKQCGHQDGKVTVPRSEFLAKLSAVRQAFNDCGVEQGVIVARTDSLGASLTKDIPNVVGDEHAAAYIKHLETEVFTEHKRPKEGEVTMFLDGRFVRPVRLQNGLYKFKEGSNIDRVVEDVIFAKKVGGADLAWIETGAANLKEISEIVGRIKEAVPDIMLTYNNSPSFAWTMDTRRMILKEWVSEGREGLSMYPDPDDVSIADERYDKTPLGQAAREYIADFHKNVAQQACVFHNLITLPEYHLEGLGAQMLAARYFGRDGQLAYVETVQDPEFKNGVTTVAHQHMSGSDLTDMHKQIFGGDHANVAGGKKNTQNRIKDLGDYFQKNHQGGEQKAEEVAVPEANDNDKVKMIIKEKRLKKRDAAGEIVENSRNFVGDLEKEGGSKRRKAKAGKIVESLEGDGHQGGRADAKRRFQDKIREHNEKVVTGGRKI